MPEPVMHVTPDVGATPDVQQEEIKAAVKTILPVKNQVNGIIDSEDDYQKFKAVTRDSAGKLIRFSIFSNCEELSAKNFSKQNKLYLDKTRESSLQIKRLLEEADGYSNELQKFLDTKEYLFTTPLARLNKHPKFITTYNGDISNALKKLSSSPPFNKAQPKEVNGKENQSSLMKVENATAELPLVPEGLEVLSVVRAKTNLPPSREFKRKELKVGQKVYVMKQSLVGEFGLGVILTIREINSEKLYKIKLDNAKTTSLKLFSAKQLAYTTPSDVILPVGTRICAYYNDGIRKQVYAGVVAEPPKINNNERYLIFYDDGYAQYGNHEDIFAMCDQSTDVADDVHENLKEFIRGYLQKFPERAMVKLQTNQITKTEYECKWWDTKVLEIDASMVKMYFIESRRTEWIYRGSTRLQLLFNELSNAKASIASGRKTKHNIVPRKPHQPYVEYTREEEVVTIDSGESDNEASSNNETRSQYHYPRRKTGGSQFLKNNSDKPRNTARKSTSKIRSSAINNVRLTSPHPDIKSHLGYKELHCMVNFKSKAFTVHICNPSCREKENPAQLKGKNPLLIPIILGWERKICYDSVEDNRFRYFESEEKNKSQDMPEIIRRLKGRNRCSIMYRAPCGRHLRTLDEISKYLSKVSSRIPIDFFSTDPELLVFRTFRAKEVLFETSDLTKGKENVPVACVNSWTDEPPPFVEYEAERFPGKNVNLNLDPDFLCGCSCTDNCQNPKKCECQQMTYYAMTGKKGGVAGYQHRRLKESIITGLYECNQRCKCNSQCGNRVVQNGLQVRLQMFKTERKGWGIRCLDDLDAGQFICIYAGQLLTDQGADEDGNQFGDEYLAELDHIEVVEKTKDGYEEDVTDIENNLNVHDEKASTKSDDSDDEAYDPDASFSDDNDSDFEPNLRSTATTSLSTRGSKKKSLTSSSSSLSTLNDDSEKSNKSLPDISNSFDSITITPCPLSPELAELLDKIEFSRTPKLSDNASEPKTVAKKSVTSKLPTTQINIPSKQIKFRSMRTYFGEESCYIMDAKSKGNIGRYLNHSCAPNVFVQNVFVDTHDLRFPAIAFFAMHFIIAGTELTWDYNYEVGTVVGKVMYCYCDARNCRGRLL